MKNKFIRITTCQFGLMLFFALLVNIASAQEKTKYWIFLTDKLDANNKHTLVESEYLSEAAITRRALRGESDLVKKFAYQDAPISQVYESDLATIGIAVMQRSRWLNAVTAWLSNDELNDVIALPYVDDVRPVKILVPEILDNIPVSDVIAITMTSSCPSDFYGPSCRQLDIVNAIPPLERGINGKGIRLGFLDTHYSEAGNPPFSHSSLSHIRNSGRLIEVRDFSNRDPNQSCNYPNSHGMSVASVATGYHEGRLIGPGYGASIYASTTECVPYERNIEEDNFVAAVEWMESEGVDVMTSSLGYFDFDSGQRSYTRSDLDGDTGITTIAFDWAAQRGVITVTSAGNGGPGSTTIGTPADGDSVISVGAVNPSGRIVSFSSRGPTADGRIKPDVSAQGSYVYLAGGTGYGRTQGTSFSAPMVAGIVTQILQVNPSLGPRDVWNVLTSTASHANNPNNNFGWGIVDADAAIRAVDVSTNSERTIPVSNTVIVESLYPNPSKNTVNFIIDVSEPVFHAELTIFDILGREVGIVHDGSINRGRQLISFDGSHLSSGIYTYMLKVDGKLISIETMIVIK